MFDVHAHLCFPEFDRDRGKVVEALKKEIKGVLVSSARYEEGLCVLDLARRHEGFLFASLGYHPIEGNELEKTIGLIKTNKNNISAVGEVGLDFHWEQDEKKREKQKEVFKKFISLSKALAKPVVIHSWDAEQEAFDLVKGQGVQAAFHCFTGKKDLALEIAESGFFISISTNVLFSKTIRKTASAIPLDRLLLETDSPFLDPDRERKRNTPENILLSAEKIAELRGIEKEDVLKAALGNAKNFLGI